ncbi:MAG: hypothetical protein GWN07_07675, partial [Actinobacteria bacterium]|nr:hypothetical protein [Actinomycetota bacterium]NIV86353.1 hypothetical protein [Actinomycetota bacterium]NIW27159.1 hypothetical protein [Actinomycetota bacterium]NIX19710.1 hypothetical protein [Actinomycetota bacterium]
MAAASVVLWLFGILAPAVVGADVTGKHVGALVLHMFAISVFFGLLAAAIAGWTGRRALASGTTAVVMVASFIAVGVLP